ncbi:hypothetical protein [Corynebacterium lowii]|uniref:Uncharacterized protein n=1 Tax=Corynebacterium lowii TaxID=1544413 RepID=A0A0Q0ZA25_9CORY|nr:hypothetical protein [Corynebacterium lowii]KQB86624.1 hypothetical protein Clow_00832 [Corynebacterium lowii]MDP9851308.1 ABC-2 type transport system permease protein [Corynebacterium lowii]
MTRTLLKLQTTLWWRTIRANPAILIMMIMVILYALMGMLSTGLVMFFFIQERETFYIPLFISLGMFAYVLIEAMMPSGEQQVTARDMALFPVSPQELRSGLWWVIFLQSRSILAVLCTALTGLLVITAAGSVAVAVIAVPLLVASLCTTVVGGSVLNRQIGRGAMGKDRMAVLGGVFFIALVLAFSMFSGGDIQIPVDTLGRVLAWTPLGAVGGAIGASISGQWGIAAVQAAIALLTLGAVLWLWLRGVAQDLEEPQMHVGKQRQKKKKKRAEDVFPQIVLPGLRYSPGAAVFSRAVRYLGRDSRMKSLLFMLPVFSIFFLYQGLTQTSFSAYMGLAILCLILTGMANNDFGFDGPGGWLHIMSGIPPRTLLLARHAGSMLIPAVVFLVYSLILFIFMPDRGVTTLVVLAGLGLVLSAAGMGLWLTVNNPFAASKPGTNPWSDRSGYSSSAMVSSFAFLFLGWLPLIPGIVLMALGWSQDKQIWLMALGGLVCVAIPLVCYLFIIRQTTAKLEDTWPEIYNKVRSWVN